MPAHPCIFRGCPNEMANPEGNRLEDLVCREARQIHPEYEQVRRAVRDRVLIFVPVLPACQFCDDVAARYDVKVGRDGPWGYLCQAHFDASGASLGVGLGQMLVQHPV